MTNAEQDAEGGGPAVHEQLRRSEEHFRLLVEGVHEYAIFMLDPTGIIASWNSGAERIKGYSADEIIGRHFSVFYPSDATAASKPERELEIARAEGFVEDEGWRVRKDGTLFWANVVITALRDDHGILVGFAKVTRDMTDRLRQQEAERKLAASQQAEREGRLIEEALRDANRRKTEFLATLSHELRNPLAPIRNGVYLLQRDVPAISRDRVHRMLETQLDHLVRLVDDLLEMSRISTGKFDLRLEVVDLNDVLDAAVDASEPLIRSKRHALNVARPENAVQVRGDPVRLVQIVVNLLHNAAKYTPDDGQIWLELRGDATHAIITVRDTGVGIPEEMQPRVFDMFAQVDQTLNRSQGGLGIGLALAQNLALVHGGALEVRSGGLGLGSEFTFRMPKVEAADVATPGNANANGHGMPLRVLVVDDIREAADSLCLVLQSMDVDCRAVYDGASAINVVREWAPTVALVDIGMPTMDGYELARLIRDEHPERQLHLVALTGWGTTDDRERTRVAGFDDHWVKPVDPRMLQALFTERR